MKELEHIKSTYKELKKIYFKTILFSVLLCNLLCIIILSFIHTKETEQEILQCAQSIAHIIESSDIIISNQLTTYTKEGYLIYLVDPKEQATVSLGNTKKNEIITTELSALIQSHNFDNESLICHQFHEHYYTYTTIIDNNYIVVLFPVQRMLSTIMQYLLLFAFFSVILIGSLYFLSNRVIYRTLLPVSESHKKQEAFIVNASHELRTPITVITNSVHAMKKSIEQQDTATFEKQYRFALSECHSASNLITTMLSLAKSTHGKTITQFPPVSPDDIVISCYERYLGILKQHDRNLEIDIPDEVLQVPVQADIVLQILSIFMDNAISHNNREQITLGYYTTPASIVFFVNCKGFVQENTANDDTIHLGLGMDIARQLSDLYNGTLQIDSTNGSNSHKVSFPIR